MKIEWNTVRFILSCTDVKQFPRLKSSSGHTLEEVAFVGRSNVGKSSLLNDLFGVKIAKTSKTPGKTQAINFFVIEDFLAFVDLPGYGYAQVAHELKKTWGDLIEKYLKNRQEIKRLVLLLDIRRDPDENDLQFIEWAHFHHKDLSVVLTKVDKLNKSERDVRTKNIRNALALYHQNLLHYSVKTGEGRLQLRKLLCDT